jgi:hypothetical protein
MPSKRIAFKDSESENFTVPQLENFTVPQLEDFLFATSLNRTKKKPFRKIMLFRGLSRFLIVIEVSL